MIIVRPPRSYPRVQFFQERTRGLTNRFELTVCIVSVGPFHVVRSSLEPPQGGLYAVSRSPAGPASSSTSMEHGAFQNVLRTRQQNFAVGHDGPLPVRASGLSNFSRGKSRLHRRRHGVDCGEVASGPNQAIGRTPRRDDCSLRPGIPSRSSSLNPPVGRADHRARQAG